MELKLVPSHPDHAEIFLKWRNERDTQAYNPLRSSTLEQLRDHLAKCRSNLLELHENETYRWFVQREGEWIAQVALSSYNWMMGTAEIGYIVAEAKQGQGLGTAVVKILVDMVFKETSIRRLVAYVHEANVASCRLLEKTGFIREGLLREHYLVNGVPTNEILFGLLRTDVRL